MSSPVYIPGSGFNNNPSSTTIKASSYTIPAGKYANVKSQVGNLSINGTFITKLETNTISTSAASGASSTATTEFYVYKNIYLTTLVLTGNSAFGSRTGAIFRGNYPYLTSGQSVGSSIATTSVTNGTSTVNVDAYYNFTGFTLVVSTASAGGPTSTGTLTISFYMGCDIDLWVPSGTVLNGANYFVTEYNV